VGDEMDRLALSTEVAEPVDLPEGRAGRQVAVADRGMQRNDVAEVAEPCCGGEGDGETASSW
jgi:hypothetical protein